MTRTSNPQRRIFGGLFILFAGVAITLATTSFPSSAIQRNGNLQITQFYYVLITGDDIRNLPSGEHRLMQRVAGGDSSTAKPPTGTVKFFLDNSSRHSSVELTKMGTGQLTLPNANSSTGVTKVGPGTLVLSGTTAAVDERLTLSGSGIGVVYEFRDLSSQEFDRIFMPGGKSVKAYVQQHRPPDAMKGWPFKRLLIGPAQGIAQAEGWNLDKIGNPTRPSEVSCNKDGFCVCAGSGCNQITAKCRSDVSCGPYGNVCWCKGK